MADHTRPLPCRGNSRLYDTALFEDVTTVDRHQAIHRAAALCAACPAPCEQMVTADSGPVELVLLTPDWLPPEREGKREPKQPMFGDRRSRRAAVHSDYVPPGDRVAVWAAMAAEQASADIPLAMIADSLCVPLETAARLLELGQRTVAA